MARLLPRLPPARAALRRALHARGGPGPAGRPARLGAAGGVVGARRRRGRGDGDALDVAARQPRQGRPRRPGAPRPPPPRSRRADAPAPGARGSGARPLGPRGRGGLPLRRSGGRGRDGVRRLRGPSRLLLRPRQRPARARAPGGGRASGRPGRGGGPAPPGLHAAVVHRGDPRRPRRILRRDRRHAADRGTRGRHRARARGLRRGTHPRRRAGVRGVGPHEVHDRRARPRGRGRGLQRAGAARARPGTGLPVGDARAAAGPRAPARPGHEGAQPAVGPAPARYGDPGHVQRRGEHPHDRGQRADGVASWLWTAQYVGRYASGTVPTNVSRR